MWLFSLASALAAPLNTAPDARAVPGDEDLRLVTASSGLRLRAAPDLQAQILEVMPPGSTVEVLGVALADGLRVGDVVGRWVPVTAASGRTGFAFSGYISDLPAPPTPCGSLKRYADRLGQPIRESWRAVEDCECEERLIVTDRRWAGATLIERERIGHIELTLSLAATSLEVGVIAAACGGRVAQDGIEQSLPRPAAQPAPTRR